MSSDEDGTDFEATRIGEILNRFFDRRRCGEAVSAAQLIATHPELAEGLRSSLEVLGELEPTPDRIQSLLRLGLLLESGDPRFSARLGPYLVAGVLGAGGMGIVLEAHEESLRRTVAIKLLRPELADDGPCRRRFAREAMDVARLKHQNIVAIHSVGDSGGVPYIVMEHVVGMSLADLISETGPLPAFFIRHVMRGLLAALVASHEAGVVHRDVKSSNVLLEDEALRDWGIAGRHEGTLMDQYQPKGSEPLPEDRLPRVKLVDFGLARVRDGTRTATSAHAVLGTPDYMSPEQARGDPEIDHRTDLYSAGIILFEMLTGRTPFRAETPVGTIQLVLNAALPKPRRLNGKADAALARLAQVLTEKSPRHRPSTAREVLESLDSGRAPPRRTFARVRVPGKLFAAAVVLLTLGLVMAEMWTPTAFDIEDCRGVDPPQNEGRKLFATFSDGVPKDITSMVSAYLEQDVEGALIKATALIGANDGGPKRIVCAGQPRDGGSSVLLAFAGHEQLCWPPVSMEPDDEPAWPDQEYRGDIWVVASITGADLDDQPGEEAIVVVGKTRREGYTRVSILDAASGEVTTTFWHVGDLRRPAVLRDFFGRGRAALALTGLNNKLDGFRDARYLDPGMTHHDKVPVVMILDPQNMEGVGPPEMEPLGLDVVMPWAYGFLDMSSEDVELESLGPAPVQGDVDTEAVLHVLIARRCELIFRRDLSLLDVPLDDRSIHAEFKAEVLEAWTQIITGHEWVEPLPRVGQAFDR